MNISAREEYLPLTPQTLYILLALFKQPMNPYRLATQVMEDSKGLVDMRRSGSLYTHLKRLEYGQMLELDDQTGVYRLSKIGREAAELEIKRYQAVVALYLDRR